VSFKIRFIFGGKNKMFIEVTKGDLLFEKRLLGQITYTATRDFALAINQIKCNIFGKTKFKSIWVIVAEDGQEDKLTTYENISLKQLYLNLHASNLISIDIFKYL
jgi:hypothetical protein